MQYYKQDNLYTFETGLNFNNASNENLIWYTSNEIKEQGLNYKNVTMIKLLPKNTIIENGSSTRISISLKYAGTTYEEEAGMRYNWHSAGYYHYSINGRELSGNFSTNGVTATLNYLNELNGFTLTAAKNMSPKIEGNINEYTTTADSLPQFINSHHFQVTNVQTYNVTLQTKEHMLANQDMAGIYANETFGITVSINGEKEVDILSTAGSETPIDVGTSTSNDVTTFHYKLYNANALSDNSKVRYIIVTLTSDNGVVIKQKINIDCEPTEAAAPESAIVAGKRYLTFDDSSSNIAISADSSFTSQFVVRYIPNLYRTKKFTFSEALPIGTMITILNKVEQDMPSYWYYKVENNLTKEIEFSNFIRMGTTDTKDYTYLTGANEIEEIFLVLVDFSQCTEVMAEGTYSLSLMFDAISTDNFSSKQLQFEIKNKRTFSLTASSSEMIFGQDVEINYLTEKTAGVESKYMSRKLALVISAPDNIPLDTHLVYNKTKYYLNSNRQFILPLGDVQSEGGSIKFSIFSELLPKISNNYLFNISLYVSATSNAEAPLFGEKVSETTITFKNQKQPQPAFKVEKSTFRTISKEKLNEIHTIDFQYLPDEDCNVFVELQQKIGSGYQKVTDKLTQVNGSTSHTMGVYSVSTMEGSNKIPFKLAPTTETGTYRLLFTIKNSNEQVISVIPYSFVIIT